MRNQFYTLLFFIFFAFSSFAQPAEVLHQIDSLEKRYAATSDPNKQFDLLSELGVIYEHADLKKSRTYFLKGLKIADTHEVLIEDRMHLELALGINYYRSGLLDSAYYYAQKNLELAQQEQDIMVQLKALNLLGMRENDIGNQKKAASYYEEGMAIVSLAPDSLQDMESLKFANNLGNINVDLSNVEKALSYFEKALQTAEKIEHLRATAIITSNISAIQLRSGNNSKTIEYASRSLEIRKQLGDKKGLLHPMMNIFAAHEANKEHKKALAIAKEGLQLAQSIENPIMIGELSFRVIASIIAIDNKEDLPYAIQLHKEWAQLRTAHDLGKQMDGIFFRTKGTLLEKQNQFLAAEEAYELALSLLKETDYSHYLETMVDLTYTYEKSGKFQEALSLNRAYNLLRDSINDENNLNKLAEIEGDRINKDNEATIAILAKDKEILAVQNRQTFTAAMGIGAVALLAFGFFWNARRKNKIITEQKTQLEELNQSKDLIFAIIGHDLRKPAIAFRGLIKKINYLLRKKDFETLNALGGAVEENAMALNKLTDNLLNWALVERNVMPYNPTKISITEVGSDVISIFQGMADGKDLQVINKIPGGLIAHADHNALSTILTNLVDNAIKYTPEGGRIKLEADTEGAQVKISVTDSGVGMDKYKLQDIFLLKTDKSKSGTKGEKGTGIGLYLVKELVGLNKGTIDVKSQLKKGTTFSFFMPKG